MSDLGRIITGPQDVAEGAAWLARKEPRFAKVLAAVGEVPLRLRPTGFEELLKIIVSQQVSVASADAIRVKMQAAGLNTPLAVLQAGEEGLKAVGFSRPKVRYALALAEESLDFDALHAMGDAQAQERLCAIKGIGPWTAQIYVMFCMGRADVFPPGDLALQEAAKALFDLPARPSAEALAAMAADWSPWRSVAARMLFAYYRVVKQRDGLG